MRINATREIKHFVHSAKKKDILKRLAEKAPILLKEPDQAQETEETEGEAEAETGGKRRKADHQPLQTTNQEQERLVTKEFQIQSQMSRDQDPGQEVKGRAAKWSGAETGKGKGSLTRKCSKDTTVRTILP